MRGHPAWRPDRAWSAVPRPAEESHPEGNSEQEKSWDAYINGAFPIVDEYFEPVNLVGYDVPWTDSAEEIGRKEID